MPTDLATLQIKVTSDGVSQATSSLNQMAQSGAQAEQSVKSLSSSSSDASSSLAGLGSQLTTMIGISLSLASGFAAIRKGIEEITTFDLGAISSAAMMLSRANIQGIEDQKTAYGEYKQAVIGMYAALEEETVRHFASGKEMMEADQALRMRGVYADQEQAGAIGTITDAVKLLHGGYVDESTMLHEIQGVLEGHAGIHFKLAEMLRQQIGPAWKEILQSHKDDETLLEFLAEQFKGLTVSSGDIQMNLRAQKSTLDTLLAQVGRAGLAGMYADLVSWLTQMNDYLREHKDLVANDISEAWAGVKDTMLGVKDIYVYLSSFGSGGGEGWMADLRDTFTGITIAVALARNGFLQLTEVIGILGVLAKEVAHAIVFDFGEIGPAIDKAYASMTASSSRWADQAIRDANSVRDSTFSAMSARTKMHVPIMGGEGTLGQPEVQPKTSPHTPWQTSAMTEPKGGGGAEDAEARRLMALYDTLNKDISRLSEGSWSEIEANLEKTLDQIYSRQETRVTDEAELEVMARKRAALQKTKLEEDFDLYVAKAMGDRYAAIDAKYKEDLTKYGHTADEKVKLDAIVAKQKADVDYKYALDIENARKGYMTTLAGVTPLLTDQITLQQQIMVIELKRNQLALDKKIRDDKIPQAEADELRGLLALTSQEQKYALALKAASAQTGLQGITAGLEQANINAINTAATSTSKMVVDAFAQMPQQIGGEMATWMVNTLQGKKTDFMQLGYSMAQSMLSALWTGMIQQIMPAITKAIMGVIGGGGGTPDLAGFDWDALMAIGASVPFAHGGVFQAFAGGGVVTSPTIFPMASGYGLMGEKGNEAVMPLTRTSSGDLGVRMEGGGGVVFSPNITVNNSAPNAQASVQTTPQGDIIVQIDDATAKAYSRGGTLRKVISQDKGMIRR